MTLLKTPILPPSGRLSAERPDMTDAQLIRLLEEMIVIREFEEKVQRLYVQGLIHGTTHLCQGQEAVCAGAAQALSPRDYVTMTYRSHGHALARGMDKGAILAELMGRATGVSKGKGGSMHLTDFPRHVIGSFGIVGAGLPVALGAAMSAKLKGEDRISVTFFGDGATNIGAFHETLNMAAVWQAPVVFICENNIYGEFSRIDETTATTKLSDRASSYNMPGTTIDGNNVLEVMETAREAAERARSGGGPTLIECVTYRHRGHSRTDPAKYRPQAEVEAWLGYDPIALYGEWLQERNVIGQDEIERMKARIRSEIDAAAEEAEAAPYPELSEIVTDTYK